MVQATKEILTSVCDQRSVYSYFGGQQLDGGEESIRQIL